MCSTCSPPAIAFSSLSHFIHSFSSPNRSKSASYSTRRSTRASSSWRSYTFSLVSAFPRSAVRSSKWRSYCTERRTAGQLVSWASAWSASSSSTVRRCSPPRSSRRAICSNGAPAAVGPTTDWCLSSGAPSGPLSRPRMDRCGPSALCSGKSCKTSTPASSTRSSPENADRTSATAHSKVGAHFSLC